MLPGKVRVHSEPDKRVLDYRQYRPLVKRTGPVQPVGAMLITLLFLGGVPAGVMLPA